jgi:hypothetical protein
VEETELARRVSEIMKAWIDRWGELTPEQQARFRETAEFHELALIPKEFGLKAIDRFRQREEILQEAKRLQELKQRQEAKLRQEAKRLQEPKRFQNERKTPQRDTPPKKKRRRPKGLPATSMFAPRPEPPPPPKRRWRRPKPK